MSAAPEPGRRVTGPGSRPPGAGCAVAGGKASPVAAVLRGTLDVDGNWRLLSLFRRLLPGPPEVKRRRAASSERSRR